MVKKVFTFLLVVFFDIYDTASTHYQLFLQFGQVISNSSNLL